MRQWDRRRPAQVRQGEPAPRVWARAAWTACGLAWLLGLATVGLAVANGLGRVLLAMGLAQNVAQASNAYAALSVDHHAGSLSGTGLATWLYSFAWMPVVALGPFLLLLFPDGRLPGRRWRPVAWTGAALLAAIVVASAVLAWPVRGTALYRGMVASTTGTAPGHALLTAALFLVGEALLVVGAVGLLCACAACGAPHASRPSGPPSAPSRGWRPS